MSKITLIGLAGHNMGDEAIALAVHIALINQHSISITSVKPGSLSKYGINEINLNRRSITSIINIGKNVYNSDIVILGGGSLIQDKLGISLHRGVLSFFLQMVLLSKLFRKKTITLPIGVDELNTTLGKVYAKIALSLLDEVHVRDDQSKKLALLYGSASKSVKVSADPALLLNPKNNSLPKKNQIVISLVRENLNHHDITESSIKLCEEFSKLNINVVLLVMDHREDDETYIYKKIVEKSQNARILIPKNIEEIFSCLLESKALIAMRLHAMILGIKILPIIGISRTTKTESFCNNYGIPFINHDKLLNNDLFSQTTNIIKNSEIQINKQIICANAEIEKVEKYFRELEML